MRATPCLIAFSTSGWTRKLGIRASQALGAAIDLDVEPVAEADALDVEIFLGQRQFLLERDELAGSALSEERRKLDNLSVIRSASSLRLVTISAEIELSALNRKCGLSW